MDRQIFNRCIGFVGLIFSVLPCVVSADEIYNAANLATVEASSTFHSAYLPAYAIDGSLETRWLSAKTDRNPQLTVTFTEPQKLDKFIVVPDLTHQGGSCQLGAVEYQDNNGRWEPLKKASIKKNENDTTVSFVPVIIKRLRIKFIQSGDGIVRIKDISFPVLLPAGIVLPDDSSLPKPLVFPSDVARNILENFEYIDISKNQWLFRNGDWPLWAKENPEKLTSWKPIKVGKSWTNQGFPSGFGWYKTNVTIPETWANDGLILWLGPVSYYDRVYFNGTPIGSAGRHPPAPPVFGSSFIDRIYIIPPSLVKYGQPQDISIRCYAGAWGGLYQGPFRIIRYRGSKVLLDFASPASKSMILRTINSSAHLNHYAEDMADDIHLRVKIQPLVQMATPKLNLSVKIKDVSSKSDSAYKTFSKDITISSGLDRICEFSLGRYPIGSYEISATVSVDGKIVGEHSTKFFVNPPLRSRLTIDPAIKPVTPSEGQLLVCDFSLSRFGGTKFTSDKRIIHDFNFGNSDGTGKVDILVRTQQPGPLLFMTDLMPSPKTPYPFAYYQEQPGNAARIEGRRGVWPFGFVSPDGVDKPISVNNVSTRWVSQKARLRYSDGVLMDVTYSLASPGVMLDTNAKTLRCFGGLSKFGLSGPTGLAWRQGEIKTFLQKNTEIKPEMDSNWILAWFNGSNGWERFDWPWVMVFQHKPLSITLSDDGCKINFAEKAGRVWLIPLMGRNPVPLGVTLNWSKQIPSNVAQKCDLLGRLMLAYPIDAVEHYRLDSSDQSITGTIVYEFDETKDDWATQPQRMAMLPPVMGLGGAYGLPMSFRESLVNLHMADAFGPTLISPDTNSITWKLTGVLDIITHDRNVSDIDYSLPETQKALSVLRSEIDRLMKEHDLSKHPWNTLQNASPGHQPRTVFPLLLELYTSWPYLSPKQQAALQPNIDKEVRYVMMNPNKMPPYRAVNGLEVATPEVAIGRIGVDHMCWTAAQLYTIWLRCKNLDSWKFSEADENFLQNLYNVLLMTSDFAMGSSWDTYAGVRLGGGIQEAAYAMCGQIAWARMMRKLGKPKQAELASYLAGRQMMAVFAQFAGNPWVREYIYCVEQSDQFASMNEQKYEWRPAELNELPGLSRSTNGGNSIFTLLLTGIPEIMRFYNRFAKDEAVYFMTHQLDPDNRESWWDTAVNPNFMLGFADYWLYIVGADHTKVYAEFLAELKRHGYQHIGNARAVLESAGKIGYTEVR